MAVNKSKRSIPAAQILRRRLNYQLKDRAYETLHDLHRGFAITHATLERLEGLNIVPRAQLQPCRYMADELQALANSVLLETLRDTEAHDAAHFEKLRLAWQERPYPKLPEFKSVVAKKKSR